VRPSWYLALLAAAALLGCMAPRRVGFEEMLERTAETRGLHVPAEIHYQVVTAKQLAEMRAALILESVPEETLRRHFDALVALGLWPREVGFRDAMAEYGSTVDGFYLPARHTIFVRPDPPATQAWREISRILGRDVVYEMLTAHEIVHALQHAAHPELFDPGALPPNQSDVALALGTAIEGDATLYGFEAAGVRELIPAWLYTEVYEELEPPPEVARLPALARYEMGFKYVKGYSLATTEGADLLERPPLSTEQVMHPEKRREAFLAIDLSGLQSVLPPDCSFECEDTVGEFGISVLLREVGAAIPASTWRAMAPKNYQVADAAGLDARELQEYVPPELSAGWDGDRYLTARCGDHVEFVWLSAWDSDRDAAQFAEAYGLIAGGVRVRGELAAEPVVLRRGREVVIATPRLLEAGEAATALARTRRVASLAEIRGPASP
jgi:hypothetical protein